MYEKQKYLKKYIYIIYVYNINIIYKFIKYRTLYKYTSLPLPWWEKWTWKFTHKYHWVKLLIRPNLVQLFTLCFFFFFSVQFSLVFFLPSMIVLSFWLLLFGLASAQHFFIRVVLRWLLVESGWIECWERGFK